MTRAQFSTLVSKVHSIDTTDFVRKTKSSLEKKISDIKTIIEKGSGAASKDELDAIENKISNVSGFLLTSTFNSKITEV